MAGPTNVASQARGLWNQLSGRRRLAAAAVVLVPLLAVAYLVTGRSSKDFQVLYANLAPEDAGEIVAELSRQGIPYRLSAAGTVLEVPKAQVHELRISTAAAGLPRGGGVGFEVFDGQSFGTSSFVEQVNYRRALSGELSRSIGALAAVSGARVHIAMGKRSVFRDADEPPTASVALRLHGGRKLTDDQVRGIVNLVASSVDGLAAERVVVIDERGTVLSSEEEDSGAAAGAADLESELAAKIQQMLERVVGVGHSAVTVTAKIDKRKVDTTEELYDPRNPSVRSETRTIEGKPPAAPSPVAGLAGAPGSLPGSPGPTANANGDGKLHEVRNYELNRTVRHTVGPSSELARLHVAVLVDYARDEEGKPVARSEEQLAQLAAIAREAAGIDDTRGDRIEVRSVPFAAEDAAAEPPEEAAADDWPLPISKQLTAVAAGGLGFLIIVVLLLLRMRKKKRDRRTQNLVLPAPVHELEAALAGADELDGDEAKQLPPPDLHTQVLEAVAENPARAGRVIAAWLGESQASKKNAA